METKAIVLIVHGLNSHSGYYEGFADQLTENHYEVYAMDLPGHGLSDGDRSYIRDFQDLFSDIDMLFDIATAAHPALPVFLFGHSAGGVFASAYASSRQDRLKGLICESFAFAVPAPSFALSFIKLIGGIIPHAKLVKLNNTDFSRDPEVVKQMDEDVLLEGESQPARTMQQLLYAVDQLKKEMSAIELPLLILHGTADRATKPSGSEYFLKHASSQDKQLKLYQGHYHDLLNDLDNNIVIKDIIQWLNERAWTNDNIQYDFITVNQNQ